MRPKILHIDNSTAVTGAYKALMSWCMATPEFEHVWVLPEGSDVVADAKSKFSVHTLPFVEIGRSPAKLLRYLPALFRNGRRLARLVKAERIDLLHANDLYNLTPYVARKRNGTKLPLIVHARMLKRSFPARIYDFWVRWHLRRADAVIAVSEAIKTDWGEDAGVQVIYDPIEVREKLPEYRFGRQATEPFRFLYLANYIQGKGQQDALAAVRLLKDEGRTDIRIDFHGGTMGLEKNEIYKRSLQDYATANGLNNLVSFGGASDNVEALMKSYHSLLHLSHAESFGMVCYEALYYGLPVISTDCGGPAEMMDPGVSGILLPVGDIAGIAGAMKDLVEHPDRCARMSVASRSFIRERFRATDDLALLFSGLAERRNGI
jgi:glycosyltransferase involved in cell wall biosynthesis